MDLDPTSGRPGTTGTSRPANALASEARRALPPPEIEREAVAPAAERGSYASPGLRPPGDVARDVILQLSPKALALAKSATTDPSLVKEVESDDDGEGERPRPRRAGDRPRPAADAPTPRIDVRA
jgi:hypothetical protein